MLAGVRRRIGTQLERFERRVKVASEERALSGSVSGAFFIIGGVTLVPLMFLPGLPHGHRLVLLALTLIACGWGASSVLLIDWYRAPRLLIHLSAMAGLVMIAAAVASSGGASSPAWVYLFFGAVFGTYFFDRAVAVTYVVLCIGATALPLLYDPRIGHDAFLGELVIAAPAYVVLGGAMVAGKSLMVKLRTRAEQLAAEQLSLRRVAIAVVEGEDPESIYELVAREAAGLLGAGAAGILRFDSQSQATVMGAWADHEGGRYPAGTVVEVRPGSDVARARETNLPIRIDGH